ncbi:MAG: hypothetical protein H7039_19425 [Bryobacteraceae bacterium]|nr:hypothetical protein [Bryobacteraceae bacterium]
MPSSDPRLEARRDRVLTNYSGYIHLKRSPVSGNGMALHVSFTPTDSRPGFERSVPLRVTGGIEASEVEFRIEIVSTTLRFRPARLTATVVPGDAPREWSFTCSRVPPGKHRLFVQVSQKDRLLQVAPLNFEGSST